MHHDDPLTKAAVGSSVQYDLWNFRNQNCVNAWIYFSLFFFLIGIHSMQDWTATAKHGVTTKRSTKRLKHTGNLFRKNLVVKEHSCLLILDLKPFRL